MSGVSKRNLENINIEEEEKKRKKQKLNETNSIKNHDEIDILDMNHDVHELELELEEEDSFNISDTYLGLELLKNQILNSVKKINFPPLILKYILSELLDKNLNFEKEIQILLKENKIKQFKIESYSKEDIGYLFYEDYLFYLKFIFEKEEEKKNKLKLNKINFNSLLEKFENKVIKKYSNISIKINELKLLLNSKNEDEIK